MRHGSLFSGIGGFDLAAQWAGFENVFSCEIDQFCNKVLEKNFPGVKRYTDIREFHWITKEGAEYAQENKNQQTFVTCKKPTRQNSQKGLFDNVSVAEKKLPCPSVLQIDRTENGNIAHGIAEQGQCLGEADQMPMVGNGCLEPITPTIKTETDTIDTKQENKTMCVGGEEGCLLETNSHAKNADSSLVEKIFSTRTTSKHGKTTLKKDSTSLMESHCAELVTNQNTQYCESIDILTAGCPCQPASCAGKRKGTEDYRWLWGEAFRIIREARPKWVILENVRGLLSLEQGVVFENIILELEALDYETETLVIPACAVGAPHRRDRIWIVAYSSIGDERGRRSSGSLRGQRCEKEVRPDVGIVGNAECDRFNGQTIPIQQRESRQESAVFAGADSHAVDPAPKLLDGGGNGRPAGRVKHSNCGCASPDSNGGNCDGRECMPKREAQGRIAIVGDDFNAPNPRNQGLQWSQWPGTHEQQRPPAHRSAAECSGAWDEPWIEAATRLCRIHDVVPYRVDRLKSLGNAVVPVLVYEIFKAIKEIMA